ncbi:outer membrane protein [Aquamicrobium terrae]
MKLKTCIATMLATAPAALMTTGALAADYDPPIFVEEAPEYVPVEVGSGWYLRGDVAYLPEKSYKHVDFGSPDISYSEREKPVFASLGFGYHFNDYLRGDVNVGWLPGNKIDVGLSTADEFATARVKNSAWTAMVNGYVDLGTYVGITPYIGAGIGVMQSRSSLSLDYQDLNDPSNDVSAYGRRNEYAFAYSLNAGAAYQITDNLVLDVGYQYLSAPDAKYFALDGADESVVRKGVDSHQIKVGLRYDLW